MPVPSPYWGDKLYWFDPHHQSRGDGRQGRVWMSSRFRRPEDQPAFCGTHPSAALAPQKSSFRQVQHDPKTRQFKQVNICFDTHHVQFAATRTRRCTATAFSGAIGGSTRASSTRRDEAKAQGWCRGYHDLNQDGKVDPAVDRQIAVSVIYSVIPHPTDGSVWGAAPGPMPGKILRIDPKTCVGEAMSRRSIRGGRRRLHAARNRCRLERRDLDGAGEQRAPRKFRPTQVQRPLQGPSATSGQHCREGWTLHPVPGPRFKGVRGDVAVDFKCTTTSSTASTRSVSAPTRRSRTARTPIRCWRCGRTEPGWCSACRIRSDSSRAAWMAASTIRRPAGRAGDLRGLWTECGVAHGRRSWHSERRREVPAAADPLAR